MHSLIRLILASAIVAASTLATAADRDAADRQTRQESDALRADIRQQRLKKVRDLDKPDRHQPPATDKSKTTGAGD